MCEKKIIQIKSNIVGLEDCICVNSKDSSDTKTLFHYKTVSVTRVPSNQKIGILNFLNNQIRKKNRSAESEFHTRKRKSNLKKSGNLIFTAQYFHIKI